MQSFKANLRTLLWAFALALAVWVAAVTSSNPDEVRTLPAPVPLEVVGQGTDMVMSTDFPRQVYVTLRAPSSVWERVTASPGSVRAILDLSGLSDGEHIVPIQVQVSERPVRIVSTSPGQVTLTLEPLSTKTLEVDLARGGQPAVGYQAGEAVLDPVEVVVAGAKSRVDQAVKARLSLNIDGLRDSVDDSLPVLIIDKDGQVLNGLSISPQSVHISIPIGQQGGYRDLAVKVIARGQVASGYRLSNISVVPQVITVYSSDPAIVGALPGVVETQPLELQDASDDITTRINLVLPPGVSVVGEQTVLIQADISPIESSLTISSELVQIMGLPSAMSAQILPETVDVIVSGPMPLLDTLTRQDIRVTVDVSGLPAGTHKIKPRVEILVADVAVVSILPGTIEVTLSPAGSTPAPTP
jgi:YbbR domain-containing protein